MNDEAWKYCVSERNIRNIPMNKSTATDNEIYTILYIWEISVRTCDNWHAVIKNQLSSVSISEGIR